MPETNANISVFGAGTFPITIYIITVLIIVDIVLIYMDKSIFFKEADDSDYSKQSGAGLEIDIRLNNTIFYI